MNCYYCMPGFFNQTDCKNVALAPLCRIINVLRRWTVSVRQPGEIRTTSPLPVFQDSHLLLWPFQCPAMTWLCLITLQSSQSCSLILPTLCPASFHNHLSPNSPYRSHWLSFVCVMKAYSKKGQTDDRAVCGSFPPSVMRPGVVYHPRFRFCLPTTARSFAEGYAALRVLMGRIMLLSARLHYV